MCIFCGSCVNEVALKANPVLAKMMISGVFYSLVDWIAQVPMGHFLITTTISVR